MKKPTYREDIDALRGISVALVVLFHAVPGFFPGGFIGVDVFFVISGYLITSIMLLSHGNGNFSLVDFYARRIRRIFPAMLLVLSMALILGWLFLFPEEYFQLGGHVRSSVIFLLNFDLINEIGYFNVDSTYKPLVHFWTLSIEEQYYMLWPILLLGFLKVSKKPEWFFLGVAVISFALNLYFVSDYQDEVYFHTATRLWQLAVGSLIAAITVNRDLPERKSLFFTGVVTIIFAGLIINEDSLYPGLLALMPVCGAVLVILSNAKFSTFLGLSALGLISYSLYLWHWLLISFSYIYLGREPGFGAMTLLVAVSVMMAYLTFRYVEPIRYRNKVVRGLLLAAIAVGLSGLYVELRSGVPERSSVSYFVKSERQFTRTPAVDASCNSYVVEKLGEERIFYYCRAENLESNKLIAIVGDSHAHAWFPGLAKIAEKHGYGALLLANSGCPPFLGFEWGRNSEERIKCQDSIGQIIKLLATDARIKKVVLTSRGPFYIHGDVDGDFTEVSVAESLENYIDKSRLNYDTYKMGFQETLSRIGQFDHVHEIFYLLENPELDFLPKEVIPRPYDFFEISVNRSLMDKGLYLKRMARYRQVVQEVESAKLKLLDPVDVLCDKAKCYSFIDGNFVYADDDHFSVYGSRLVSRYFSDEIFDSTNASQGSQN